MTDAGKVFLRAEKMSKSFGSNKVLFDMSMDVEPGKFYGLIGENGAGKSTFINLLTGMIDRDDGEVFVDSKKYDVLTPALAKKLGIYTVHQELSINLQLTVTENIFLGNELHKGVFLDMKTMKSETKELLSSVGLQSISPDCDASSLTMAELQMIEFCKAAYQHPKLLILDEATSALDDGQVRIMFDMLREMKKSGMAMIFISHRMHELFEICDILTVLKDGHQVATGEREDFDQENLVKLMTGRTIVDLFPPKRSLEDIENKEVMIKAEKLAFCKSVDIDFEVRKGEIVGIGGLQGQGQQEILECLFGLKRVKGGKLYIKGKPVKFDSPKDAMKADIAYLPAERKTQGLFTEHSMGFNTSLVNLDKISRRLGTIKSKLEADMNGRAKDSLSIKLSSFNQLVGQLSGGNQQKVVLAKWLEREPTILLLNEPTRGIDVGTKKEIYELLYALAQGGTSIVMLSSDAMELIGMCDLVFTVYENKINGILRSDVLNEESLVAASVFRKEGLANEK
ncbi:MAG: sugar ABC transporter ATP-binding protein [Oscillospiraceae bacterium]